MINPRASLLAFALIASLLDSCGDTPQQALFVSGSRDLGGGELAGASVNVDGKVVGALKPMLPPRWFQWLAEKWLGKNLDLEGATLDGAFVLAVDLRGGTAGVHTVVVKTPAHTLTRTFHYPDDLEEDAIWVRVGSTVNWPWCSLLVPPLLDCAHGGSVSDIGRTVDAETICRLVGELRNCLDPNAWIGTEAIEVCPMDGKTSVSAVLYNHRLAGLALLNEDTGEILCETSDNAH